MSSILKDVRKMIGPSETYTHFDQDLIIHINSVFTILKQLGVGPANGFSISSEDDDWTDFLPGGEQLELAKSYMYLKVRLMFDISTLTSPLIEVMNRQISEFEYRLNTAVEFEKNATQ